MITERIVWEKLRALMKGKSQRATAKQLGVSSQYFNDIVKGKRSVLSPSILKALGYKKQTVITPLTKGQGSL